MRGAKSSGTETKRPKTRRLHSTLSLTPTRVVSSGKPSRQTSPRDTSHVPSSPLLETGGRDHGFRGEPFTSLLRYPRSSLDWSNYGILDSHLHFPSSV